MSQIKVELCLRFKPLLVLKFLVKLAFELLRRRQGEVTD